MQRRCKLAPKEGQERVKFITLLTLTMILLCTLAALYARAMILEDRRPERTYP
jgi:hypothetical protein